MEKLIKPDTVISIGDKTLRVPHEVWAAFLRVADFVVGSGDMFPLAEDDIGREMLDRVREAKIEMDDHCESS
jgi:hypothetical protein